MIVDRSCSSAGTPRRQRVHVRNGRQRAGAALAALAAGIVTVLAAAPAGAAQAPGALPDVVEVDGVEVPMLGTFARRVSARGDGDLVRGAVHGVQRVDGGTVLYASVGLAADAVRDFNAGYFFRETSRGYPTDALGQMYLVDRVGLKVYRLLLDGETTFTTSKGDVRFDRGELGVVWGVFPELPASVESVDVVMGDTQAVVARVPVGDGVLDPVSDEPAPLLGTGWPEVPAAEVLAQADPAESIFDLARRTESADEIVAAAESTEQVAATLDANVLFDKSSATLTAASAEALAGVAADIAARGTGEVVVTGHTDSDGTSSSNQTLSEQRAAAVVAALQPASGGAVTFSAEGRGERDPVAPNDTPENMQLNRRVTVVYQIGAGS